MLQFCVTIYKGSQAKIAALPLIVQKTGGQKLGITLFSASCRSSTQIGEIKETRTRKEFFFFFQAPQTVIQL